jgi:hypothetical protein
MDPPKRSGTIEVMAADEAVLGGGRYGTAGHAEPSASSAPGPGLERSVG